MTGEIIGAYLGALLFLGIPMGVVIWGFVKIMKYQKEERKLLNIIDELKDALQEESEWKILY